MSRGRRAARIGFAFAAIVALHACGDGGVMPSSVAPVSAPLSRPQAAPLARSGLRAWVDPATGRLGAPPVADDVDLGGRGAAAADAAAPALMPGRTSAGGRMVDLRGHFEFTLRASVSADGRLGAQCDAGDDLDRRE